MLRGIDVSYAQKSVGWTAVKQEGQVAFVYARASQGTTITDDYFKANHDQVIAEGLPFGSYHFYSSASDGLAQAEYFLNLTDGRIGTLVPVLDVEELSFSSKPPVAAVVASIDAFLTRIQQEIGRMPIIYTNYDTWQTRLGNSEGFAGHPLWVAQTLDPNKGLYGGWTDWVLWQDSTTNVAGIADAVDLDLLNPAHTLADITL
jgi:lysozyme